MILGLLIAAFVLFVLACFNMPEGYSGRLVPAGLAGGALAMILARGL